MARRKVTVSSVVLPSSLSWGARLSFVDPDEEVPAHWSSQADFYRRFMAGRRLREARRGALSRMVAWPDGVGVDEWLQAHELTRACIGTATGRAIGVFSAKRR